MPLSEFLLLSGNGKLWVSEVKRSMFRTGLRRDLELYIDSERTAANSVAQISVKTNPESGSVLDGNQQTCCHFRLTIDDSDLAGMGANPMGTQSMLIKRERERLHGIQ